MKHPYRYYLCDVFTDHLFGGNPLAVFPQADGLTTDLMRCIARELNISKTAFVFPPETRSGTHRLRTFSPSGELPLGYHCSIGTAFVLAWIGDVPPADGDQLRCCLECDAVPFEVVMPLDQSDHAVVQVAAGHMPKPGPLPPPYHRIAEVLSLHNADVIHAERSPQIVRCGFPCLIVPLRSLDAVRRVQLQARAWEELAESCRASCVYVFSYETLEEDCNIHCRFFAPALGMDEEPAAGRAAVGLASFLADGQPRDTISATWQLEQGVEMGRPSKLVVEVEKRLGAVSRIRVGGAAVYVGQGDIDVETDMGFPHTQFGKTHSTTWFGALTAS